MQIGWVCYSSLRRDLLQPRGAVDKYYTFLRDWYAATGQPVHWIQLKNLVAGVERPGPNALPDEIAAHSHVIHYGDAFKVLPAWIREREAEGIKLTDTLQHEAPAHLIRYQIPHLDAVIIDSTGMPGGIYPMMQVVKMLHRVNPKIGMLISDQDLSFTTVKSKLNHSTGLEDWATRTIVMTNFLGRRHACQVAALHPHLDYLERPMVESCSGEVCYVGNDYQRRDQMLRLMQGERFHHYGTFQNRTAGEDFKQQMTEAGVQLHGPFIADSHTQVEDLYRRHGIGIHMTRNDGYRIHYFCVRLSEINRAGALALVDREFKIGLPLCSKWASVRDWREATDRANYLAVGDQDYRRELFDYQRSCIRHYVSSQRYFESIWTALYRLTQGPMTPTWGHNCYGDLMQAADVPLWKAD